MNKRESMDPTSNGSNKDDKSYMEDLKDVIESIEEAMSCLEIDVPGADVPVQLIMPEIDELLDFLKKAKLGFQIDLVRAEVAEIMSDVKTEIPTPERRGSEEMVNNYFEIQDNPSATTKTKKELSMEYLDDITAMATYGKTNGFILSGMVDIVSMEYHLDDSIVVADIKLLLSKDNKPVLLNGEAI